MQLLESPIPPLTAAALRIIICKRLAPPDDHLKEAGPHFDKGHEKCIYETLHNEVKCDCVEFGLLTARMGDFIVK